MEYRVVGSRKLTEIVHIIEVLRSNKKNLHRNIFYSERAYTDVSSTRRLCKSQSNI
jgi:hypothetical protein